MRRKPLPVSVLFNEPKLLKSVFDRVVARFSVGFSALQRAEIAEIGASCMTPVILTRVSVLFNEPKLLKFVPRGRRQSQRHRFQCSSTSRNC